MTNVWLRSSSGRAIAAFAVSALACGGRTGARDQGEGGGAALGGGGAVASGGTSNTESGKSGAPSGGGSGTTGSYAGCQEVRQEYARALHGARRCDPFFDGLQCQETLSSLPCDCPTPIEGTNTAALEQLNTIRARYERLECTALSDCSLCLQPLAVFCNADGLCEGRYTGADVLSCKVGGKVYSSGTDGIPDPGSCNTCGCVNGELRCTEIGCSGKCPAGTVISRQCAECGPTDRCVLPEYDCLPVCTTTCDDGACVDGICRKICG